MEENLKSRISCSVDAHLEEAIHLSEDLAAHP